MKPSTSPRCSPVGLCDVHAVEIDRVVVDVVRVDIPQPWQRVIHSGLQSARRAQRIATARCGPARPGQRRLRESVQYDLRQWRPKLLRHLRSATATDPRSIQVEPEEHLPRLGRVAGGLRRARPEDRRVRRAAGHARPGARAAAGGAAAARRDRPARIQGVVLRVALVRPGSARQPDQRAGASRCRFCSRRRRRRRPGSIPSC